MPPPPMPSRPSPPPAAPPPRRHGFWAVLCGIGRGINVVRLLIVNAVFFFLLLVVLLLVAGGIAGSREARTVADGYTTVLRGIPDLLVIYLFYFGGSAVVTAAGRLFGAEGFIGFPGFLAGSLAVGVTSGAQFTEIFRGGFKAVHPGEIEAAVACGMSRRLRFRRIVAPLHQLLVDNEAIARVVDRGRQHLLPFELAEAALRLPHAFDGAVEFAGVGDQHDGPAKTRQHPRGHNPEVAHPRHVDTGGIGGLRVFTAGAQPQPKRRAVYQKPQPNKDQQSQPCGGVGLGKQQRPQHRNAGKNRHVHTVHRGDVDIAGARDVAGEKDH